MREIQSKLDSLQPYIVGIRYVQGLQVVDAVFKEGWTVPESDVIRKELVEEGTNYYMFFTEKEQITFDDLLEYVEGIITINIEKEKKQELFKIKVKELQDIFKKNTLTKLSTLRFKFNEPDLLPSLNDDVEISMDEEISVTESDVTEKINTSNNIINEAPIIIPETISTKVKGQEIELPPKGEKIVIEEFDAKVVCKCGPDDVCPVCEEEKFG